MRSIKQLFRQPIKLFAGILLVSLSVAILTVCVGQYTATTLSRKNLDDRYTTIGLLTDKYFWSTSPSGRKSHSSHLPEKTQAWIERLILNRTDIVRSVSSTGLISAFIPDLKIDNFTQHLSVYSIGSYNNGYPYRSAMLTVKLTKIGTIGTDKITYYGGNPCLFGTTYLCVGTVESVVGLEQSFESPVGKSIVLAIKVYPTEEFEALNLQVGETYLVYGDDYCDSIQLDVIFDNYESYEELIGEFTITYDENALPDYGPLLGKFDCMMTLFDLSTKPTYRPIPDEQGNTIGWEVSEDQRQIAFWNKDHVELKWIPEEEYVDLYQTPAITPLNGSVDEFLASEEGALWREALEKMEINNHAFPVLCVDKLGYQAAFSRELARIVDGRDFSEAELQGGEKVCIIAQSLAEMNGLQVGDTIDMQTYFYDPTYEAQSAILMWVNFPSAAIYSEALGFSSEMETYTIVGLYRQEDAWRNSHDQYGFTPNTIFVPKNSVTAETLTKDKGIYSTLIIENGMMDELNAVMAEANYPGLFVCYDQGYTEFVSQLDAYEEVSAKALYIGIAAYAVLMLLFIFLFPMMHRKALVTMFSFGAPRGKRIQHICVSTAAILLPGTVIGAFAGAKLWTQVASRLMQSLNIEIPLEANMPVIAPTLAAAHLILIFAATLFAAIILTKNNSVMKNK